MLYVYISHSSELYIIIIIEYYEHVHQISECFEKKLVAILEGCRDKHGRRDVIFAIIVHMFELDVSEVHMWYRFQRYAKKMPQRIVLTRKKCMGRSKVNILWIVISTFKENTCKLKH